MPREELSQPHLVVPAEILLRVAREHHIVWRVRVNEITRAEPQPREIVVGESPAREGLAIVAEVARVIDLRIAAEGHVEFAAAVEAAQPVVTGAVEKVEERGGLGAVRLAAGDQPIE